MAKRVLISQIEDEDERRSLPLEQLINFGPVTLAEFHSMKLRTFGQLEDLGWEEVCRKWVEHFPERLNVNAFVGVIATLEGISWTKVSSSDKAKARQLVRQITGELGIHRKLRNF